MAEPFQRRTRAGGNLVARLLGRRPRLNATCAIEDALAAARRVSEVAGETIAQVAASHGVDVSQRLHTQRRNLYRRFLEHCLLDHALSDEEATDLAHLRGILRLSDAAARQVHEEVALAVYGNAIDRVLEDHQLDPEEEKFLRQLRTELELPDEVAERLHQEGFQRAKQRYLEKAVRRESVLFAPRETALELTAASQTSAEDAIRKAVEEAYRAVPELGWVELSQVRAQVGSGRVLEWQVKLKGGLAPQP